MPRRKLSDEDALALVLAGLKGEEPLAELCRRYGVSETTYYKLRDRLFVAAGADGMTWGPHTGDQGSAGPIRELERVLGKKSLQIEPLKKTEELFGRRGRGS